MAPLLDVRDLRVSFDTDDGCVHAVNGVSFVLEPGEALGIVGESGSGKSVSMLAVMGLVPSPGRVSATALRYRGLDLNGLDDRALRDVRGAEIALVHQDPMTSLNPVLPVGTQLTQVIRHHLRLGRRAAAARAVELLTLVGLPDPRRRMGDYPHQFSGGQRQRVLIALALSCEPSVLIADEPTTALDVTVQAQILELVKDLRRRLNMAIVWITHDLGVVAGLVDRVAVMYAGRVVEEAPVRQLFARPSHPYTIGLLGSLPAEVPGGTRRLLPIPGSPPDLRADRAGCAFAPRCKAVEGRCRRERPDLAETGVAHAAACFRSEAVAQGAALEVRA